MHFTMKPTTTSAAVNKELQNAKEVPVTASQSHKAIIALVVLSILGVIAVGCIFLAPNLKSLLY